MAGGKGKRKKRGRKPDNPAQSKRFIEAAKRLGLDQTGKSFKEAMDKIVPTKPRNKGSA